MLTATGIAGAPESYFHTPSLADWLEDYDLDPGQFPTEIQALEAIVRAALERGRAGTGIFGLRLQRPSFAYLVRQLKRLHPQQDGEAALFAATFGRPLFVHLTRRDKLDQAISRVKAEQTGLWHLAPDGTEIERLSDPRDPDYDPDAIAAHLSDLTAYDAEWTNWFATEGISPLQITYDQLSAAPAKQVARILTRLGLDPAASTGIDPPVAKLADATSRQWKRRFLAERGRETGPPP